MAVLGKLTLTGASGNTYAFNVYSFDSVQPVACVYALTNRHEKDGDSYSHTVIYFGETGNLDERFDGHHKIDCFKEHNANALGIHQDDNQDSRRTKEADLIAAYDPPCND